MSLPSEIRESLPLQIPNPKSSSVSSPYLQGVLLQEMVQVVGPVFDVQQEVLQEVLGAEVAELLGQADRRPHPLRRLPFVRAVELHARADPERPLRLVRDVGH